MSNSALVDITSDDEPGNIDKLKKELTEAVSQSQQEEKVEAEAEFTEDPKYRGKTREEIIDMHRNAEKKIGQSGNELGQYKQLTDQLLDLKRREDLAKGGAEEEEDEPLPQITATEILDDPDAAVAKAVEARLDRAERKRQREAEKEQQAKLMEQFQERHPDAQDIAQSPEFEAFANSTPSRQMLAAAAINAGNLAAASVLLDEWKASKEPAKEEAPQKDPNIEKARAAATISSGSSTASDAPTGKVYRRIDLIKLKLQDPETYSDPVFQEEILKAYNEGRVK